MAKAATNVHNMNHKVIQFNAGIPSTTKKKYH